MKLKLNPKIIIRIILVTLLLFGIGFSIYGFYSLQDALNSKTWPSVDGKIISSEIKTRISSTSTKNEYEPIIRYEYSVEGKIYISDKILFGSAIYLRKKVAENFLNNYKVGKKVQAFYNPNNPNISVLEPGANWDAYKILLFGLGFIIISLIIFFLVRNINFNEVRSIS